MAAAGFLKTALRLMSAHRLKIDGFGDAETVYTGWIESVQVRGENQEVYLTFSPRFKRIWSQAKKRMPDYLAQNPANIGLRSKYALRLVRLGKEALRGWNQAHYARPDVRKLLGLESVKDATGNIIREAPLPVWANFRQRALDVAIREINQKTDLHVEIESLEKLGNRVNALNFSIKTRQMPSA